MASETWIERRPELSSSYLQKFRLYETRSNFYMIGRDKSKTLWRVLKIDRTEPVELDIHEDATNYSETECFELLRRIHEGNRPTGGLRFVTTCYGIIGFVRFLGPYYMLIITRRKKLGAICGQTIYSISKSEMVIISNASVQSSVAYSKDEKRYKKLLCTVDLTKDFYFSYSYHVMHSLQKNLCNNENGQAYYESMFVWNEYLTRGIRNNLKNSMWTVALVYGFFKQIQLSIAGKNCKLTLIARRSRYYAGTRYLKRGVNEKGRVANDVETEQIVFEDVPEGFPIRITSVLQNRGSIPLSWSQETSRLNIKPDIILSRKDSNYEATRLHFENLVKRYGNPIIILNLIKTREKRPRETILRAEFANAIRFINKGLSKENRLRPLHWDLHKHSRNKATNVLAILSQLATYALNLTGIFYCQLSPGLRVEGPLNPSILEEKNGACSPDGSSSKDEKAANLADKDANDANEANVNNHIVGPMFQKGVLRTNCIDCLDRTNVAQYAYGLVALGRQLHALGITRSCDIDLDNPLAEDLMGIYETMGDTLALQYGGSAAHNKIFSERRGQWKAATQSQEFFRTLQRYYSNAYMDAEKQDAINVFLGYFQPQASKPALWELGSDQHYKSVRFDSTSVAENSRSMIKRSLSEGSILCESDSAVLKKQDGKGLSGSVSGSRQPFEDVEKDHVLKNDCFCFGENGDQCKCTNFDLDWISSSGNSCEEDSYARSVVGQSSDNITSDDIKIDSITSASQYVSSLKGEEKKGSEANNNVVVELPEKFVRWVIHGESFFRGY